MGAGPPGAMIILAWNGRGLGLDPTVGELWDLIRSYNLAVVVSFRNFEKNLNR